MTGHNQTSRWQSRMRLIALDCTGALRCAADESRRRSDPPLFGHTYRGQRQLECDGSWTPSSVVWV
jgi:hypothetical protein